MCPSREREFGRRLLFSSEHLRRRINNIHRKHARKEKYCDKPLWKNLFDSAFYKSRRLQLFLAVSTTLRRCYDVLLISNSRLCLSISEKNIYVSNVYLFFCAESTSRIFSADLKFWLEESFLILIFVRYIYREELDFYYFRKEAFSSHFWFTREVMDREIAGSKTERYFNEKYGMLIHLICRLILPLKYIISTFNG